MAKDASSFDEADKGKVQSESKHVETSLELGEDPMIEDSAEVKAIKRKSDIRIVALLGFMYTVAVIDRVNLGNAQLAGMGAELELTGNKYNIILLVFFPFYVCFQAPMVVVGRKVGPKRFLSFIVTSWGIIMLSMGLVKNWWSMIPLRCVLGIFEAGYFSTSTYLLSAWYTRGEVAKRNSGFFLFGNLLAGFGGIIAYGLSLMEGVGGYRGWRWILIIEGVVTVLIGLSAYLFIVDFPEKASKSWNFLTEKQLKIVIDRINRDRPDVQLEPFSVGSYLKNGRDWTVWCHAANMGLTSLVIYAQAYFLPTLLRESLGFSVAVAQCLTTPPYVLAFIYGMGQSWLSDRIGIRGPFFIANCLLEVMGICLLTYAKGNGPRYFGAMVISAAAFANIAFSMTYQANNIVGQWKRAFCSATLVAGSGMGGIVGSLVFRSQDAPDYRPGIYTCIIAALLCVVSMVATETHFYLQNRKQAQGKLVIADIEGFRYTY